MNFVRIDANILKFETQAGELVKDINWINKAQEHFSIRHNFSVLKNMEGSFDLFPEFSDVQKFQLGVIYVVNKNVKSTAGNIFKFDADGDGLIDELEINTDFSSLRSDSQCLDSLKNKFSECLNVGCNPRLDNDGDGLNECEEKTYGTDDYNPDSDNDSILDYDEVIMGYSPKDNDQTNYFNADGYSNFEHFIRGLSYKTNINGISDNNKIGMIINSLGMTSYKNMYGLSVEMPIYSIKVINIPYLHLNDAVSKENSLVVRVRIDDKKNPQNNYWYTKTYNVNADTKEIQVYLSEFKPLFSRRTLK